jgi:hypothetical protein
MFGILPKGLSLNPIALVQALIGQLTVFFFKLEHSAT